MNRAACDNALLGSCERLYSGLELASKIGMTGTAVALFWYGCVFARASGWI
jgi:hypothetical protein